MILELRELDTYYGLAHVLHGLSIAVDDGEIVALLGRNGAGKTTTLRSITGLTPPRAGRVRFKGEDLAGRAPQPETRGIFSCLTARENLDIARRPGGHFTRARVGPPWWSTR